MSVFGQAQDPELWEGRLYRRGREGMLVQRGDQTVYLRGDLGRSMGPNLHSASVWARWRQIFRRRESMGTN